ncbi:hypothetical protein JW948_03245 [bacterium]|nr:hypothetical protein [bacterium]
MNHAVLKAGLILVLLTGPARGLFSESTAPITVSSEVDKSRITIGDLIHYSITVIHDDSVQVTLPGFAANLGSFEIRDYKIEDPEKEKGQIVSRASYTISTFFTGEFEIPPLAVQYTAGQDSVPQTLMTEKIRIVVESMKASEAGDIRDVKAPLEIPRNWWYTFRWILPGLAVLMLAFAGILIYRRRKAGRSLIPVREAPPRPAHEIAIEALDNLILSEIWQKGEIKRFYTEISEIIREYINGRYFVVALEMTTTEVLAGLREHCREQDTFLLFQTFLENCDLVKFAKLVPSEELHQQNIHLAYEIVERTKLELTAPDEADAAPGPDENTGANPETAPVTEQEESLNPVMKDDEGQN